MTRFRSCILAINFLDLLFEDDLWGLNDIYDLSKLNVLSAYLQRISYDVIDAREAARKPIEYK